MHHHRGTLEFLVACWTFWFMGQYFSVLMKAYGVVGSRLNSVTSYSQFFQIYIVPILARTFASVLIMMVWERNPEMFSASAVYWMPDSIKEYIPAHALSLNPAAAGLAGLMFDGVLDKASPVLCKLPGLAWLQPYIPPAKLPMTAEKPA